VLVFSSGHWSLPPFRKGHVKPPRSSSGTAPSQSVCSPDLGNPTPFDEVRVCLYHFSWGETGQYRLHFALRVLMLFFSPKKVKELWTSCWSPEVSYWPGRSSFGLRQDLRPCTGWTESSI